MPLSGSRAPNADTQVGRPAQGQLVCSSDAPVVPETLGHRSVPTGSGVVAEPQRFLSLSWPASYARVTEGEGDPHLP
jgi:hypothetical protein